MNKFDISVVAKLSREEGSFNGDQWEAQDRQYFGDAAVDKWGWQHDHKVYVVVRTTRGSIIGVGQMNVSNGVGFVYSVIIAPDYRGNSIGRTIFEKLEEEARKEGLFYVWLETREEWVAAMKLYESCGFEVTQKMPVFYYGEPWVAMGKKLNY